MFLITPKPKNIGGQASQPVAVAKIKQPARVLAACDRCRMKKVKCNGVTPCMRCTQDGIICLAGKKAPRDPKEATIE